MATRFSVIMANYNGEKYISDAIESVLAQDYDDYEFIIVDDGSKDNSATIIASYQQKYPHRITVIFQETNQGQGAAFNVGISAATGELISFIDSDDVWFPQKLKIVDRTFGDPERVAVHQHNLCITSDGSVTNVPFREAVMIGDYFSFVKGTKGSHVPQFIATTGLTFPRDILKKVLPIPLDFRTCADGYLTRTCFCFGEVVAINDFLGGYRVHGENLTYQNPAHDNDHYVSTLLFPALNRFYEKNDIKLKFHHNLNLYERSVLRLGLQAGDRVLVLRCARIDYVERIIETLLKIYKGISIDLATQESFLDSITHQQVTPIIIPEGPITHSTFGPDFQSQVGAKSYDVVIIPYSNYFGEDYANVHKVLALLPQSPRVVGIGHRGQGYKFYRLGRHIFRLVPPFVSAWSWRFRKAISGVISPSLHQ